MSRGLWAALVFGVTACLSTAKPFEPLPAGGHHVLFIGNSLTYVNDLPGTVAAIATSAGDTIRVASAAGPNLALIDHLTGSTDAVTMIKAGGWEFVVLQQGPTPAGICRDSLVLWSRMFDPLIRGVGAKPAVMMSWPSVSYPTLWDDVRVSFQSASAAIDGTFMPAGEAWRIAWTADPTLPLYGADGFHPSELGTFLTAIEIYERVTGHDARALPTRAFANGHDLSVSASTIRLLQQAAHDANARYPAKVPAASSATGTLRSATC